MDFKDFIDFRLNMLSFLIPILFSLGQLGRISFYNQQVNIYIYEILIILQFLIFIYKYQLKPVKFLTKKIFILPVFLIWLIFSFFISIGGYPMQVNFVGSLYLFRLFMYIGWGIYSYYHFRKVKAANNHFFRITLIFTLLIVIISLIQFILYPDLINLRYLGWDTHYNRLFSLFFDTSTTGAILGMLTWIFVFLRKKIKPIGVNYGLIFLCFLCGILTFSRNFYGSFAFSLIIFTLATRNWKMLMVFIFSFIIILIVVPKQFGPGVGLLRFFTVQSRIIEYSKAIDLWKKSPVMGIGYNRIKYVKEEFGQLNKNPTYPSHAAASFSSSFAIILVTSGIIGIILFILLLIQIGMINSYAAVVISFIGMMSFGDNILLHPFILFLLAWSMGNINLFDK